MFIALVIPSNYLILCHHLFLLPLIFLSFRVFSKEQAGEGNDKLVQHICRDPKSCIKKPWLYFTLGTFLTFWLSQNYHTQTHRHTHTHTHTQHFISGHFLTSNQLKAWAGTSLVDQWWRIQLPMQGMAVQSLIVVIQLLSYVWLFAEPMDCSPPGSFVCGISWARILESVAISSSRGSFWLKYWTPVSCIAARFFTAVPPGEVPRSLVREVRSHKLWSN